MLLLLRLLEGQRCSSGFLRVVEEAQVRIVRTWLDPIRAFHRLEQFEVLMLLLLRVVS